MCIGEGKNSPLVSPGSSSWSKNQIDMRHIHRRKKIIIITYYYVWDLIRKIRPKDMLGNWGLSTMWEKEKGGRGCDFKWEENNSLEMGKQMFTKQMFALPGRDSGIQRGLWSPGHAECPSNTPGPQAHILYRLSGDSTLPGPGL